LIDRTPNTDNSARTREDGNGPTTGTNAKIMNSEKAERARAARRARVAAVKKQAELEAAQAAAAQGKGGHSGQTRPAAGDASDAATASATPGKNRRGSVALFKYDGSTKDGLVFEAGARIEVGARLHADARKHALCSNVCLCSSEQSVRYFPAGSRPTESQANLHRAGPSHTTRPSRV